jgi:hypothetical protein
MIIITTANAAVVRPTPSLFLAPLQCIPFH